MLVQIKFLKKHGSFGVGAIGECEEDYANELIAKGIAMPYDAEAEKAEAERRAQEVQSIVEATVKEVTTELKQALTDPKVKAVTKVHERSEDDPEAGKQGFKSLGDYALSVKSWTAGHRDDKRMLTWLTKAAESPSLVEGIDSDGGYLVPEEFSREILTKTYERAALVDRCREIPMTSKSIKIPYIKETSRADGSRQGGIRAYRAAELGQLTPSQPSFGRITLEVEKLYVYVPASDELLEDATAMGAMIASAAADELAFKMDDEIINGTGAGMPLGILNAGCLVAQAKESGQAAGTIVTENIVKMYSRMWGPSRSNAVWIINQDVEPQLYTMSLAVGSGGLPVYLPPNGLAGTPYGTLLGRPVIPCESCPTRGTVGDIIFADLSQYLFARHVSGVQAATSIHLKFDYDQTVFRFTVRCDGQPWWPSALTPKSGSGNTLSPFVALATRA